MFKFIMPKLFLNIERWKWNADYRIYVSNMGHFKNEYRQDIPININRRDGYCVIKTPYIGYRSAHRLVMLTWKPIPDAENLTVDHLDHNKRNNVLSNLEWITEEENLRRAEEDLASNIMNTSSKSKKKKNKKLTKKERIEQDTLNLMMHIATMEANPDNTFFCKRPVTNGEKVFTSVGVAVAFCLGPTVKENGTPSKKTIKRVHNNLVASIQNGTQCYGKKWRFIENE